MNKEREGKRNTSKTIRYFSLIALRVFSALLSLGPAQSDFVLVVFFNFHLFNSSPLQRSLK